MPVRSSLRNAADKLVVELPDAPSRTLAKRLAKEYHVSIEQARSAVRNSRGINGVQKRKETKAVVKYKPRKAGWKPKCPPSIAEPWLPFELPGRRIGYLSDVHIPFHCERALNVAVDHLRKWKPDCLFLNGDVGDFYSHSRFQKNPKYRDPLLEIGTQREFWQWLREGFPKIPIVYKLGNHDERWRHYLWNNADALLGLDVLELSEVLRLGPLGVEIVEDQRPCMAGQLPIFHGHEIGKGITSPVNPARGAFLRTRHTVMVGHSHQTSSHAESDMWHKETFIWSTGCLCDLTPEFARVNKWNHGFATVEIYPGGEFDVSNLRISKDWKVRKS